MKKISLIALTALACMGISSCDEYTLPNPPAQCNEPEPVFQSSGLQLVNLTDKTIDLTALSEAGKPVDLFSYELEDFPESYTLRLTDVFSADESFTKTESIDLTLADGIASVRTGELQQVFNTLVSKSPETRKLYSRVEAYAVSGTSIARIGGPEMYYFDGEYTVTPIAPSTILEDSYYLVGNFCDWDLKKAVKLNQTNEGNVYDNPDFYATLEVTEENVKAGGLQWKLVPGSCVANNTWAGAYGVTDLVSTASSTTGSLIESPEAETRAYTITTEGAYMVKVNVETQKFEVMLAFNTMWIPGNGYSTTDFASMMRMYTTDYIHYEGSAYLRTTFWFTGQANLRGIVYRPDGDLEFDAETMSFSGKMALDNAGTGMMRIAQADRGLYYLTANINELTYTGVRIGSIQLIGSYNGWSTDTAKELTPNSKWTEWTVKDVEMEAGEYKFCVDHAWTYSYGGETDDIRQNGGNLKIEEAGKYDFVLSFESYPAHLKVTKH